MSFTPFFPSWAALRRRSCKSHRTKSSQWPAECDSAMAIERVDRMLFKWLLWNRCFKYTKFPAGNRRIGFLQPPQNPLLRHVGTKRSQSLWQVQQNPGWLRSEFVVFARFSSLVGGMRTLCNHPISWSWSLEDQKPSNEAAQEAWLHDSCSVSSLNTFGQIQSNWFDHRPSIKPSKVNESCSSWCLEAFQQLQGPSCMVVVFCSVPQRHTARGCSIFLLQHSFSGSRRWKKANPVSAAKSKQQGCHLSPFKGFQTQELSFFSFS